MTPGILVPPVENLPLVQAVEQAARTFGWSPDATRFVRALVRASWQSPTSKAFQVKIMDGTPTTTTRSRFVRAGVPTPKIIWTASRLWYVVALRKSGCSLFMTSEALGCPSTQAFSRWGMAVAPRRRDRFSVWVKRTTPDETLQLVLDAIQPQLHGWKSLKLWITPPASGRVAVLTQGGMQS